RARRADALASRRFRPAEAYDVSSCLLAPESVAEHSHRPSQPLRRRARRSGLRSAVFRGDPFRVDRAPVPRNTHTTQRTRRFRLSARSSSGAFSGGLPAFSGGLPAFSGGLPAFSGGLLAFSGGLLAFSGGLLAFSGGLPAFSGGLPPARRSDGGGAGRGGSGAFRPARCWWFRQRPLSASAFS